MTVRSTKPPILRSKRGIVVLMVAILALFAVIYAGVGATAFLRTAKQDTPSIPSGAGVGAGQDAQGQAGRDGRNDR